MKATTDHLEKLDKKLTELIIALSSRISALEQCLESGIPSLEQPVYAISGMPSLDIFEPKIAEKLKELGYHTLESLKGVDKNTLLSVKGWGDKTVTDIMEVIDRV